MPSERTWVIGASRDCDLVIDQETVSGRHCRLIQTAAGFYVEDLESTNGTYVNGRRVTSRVGVAPTDVILLGSKVAMPWPTIPQPVARPVPTGAPSAPVMAAEPPPQRQWPLPGWVTGAASAVVLAGLLMILTIVDSARPARKTDVQAGGESGGSASIASTTADANPALARPRDRDAVANRPADVAPPEQTASSDFEAVVKAQERNVVWVGFRLRDYVFPHATGWLARPDGVVTTATVIADLEPFTKDGFEVVAYHDGKIVPVKSLQRHPGFDHENPGSQKSVHCDIGMAVLEEPISQAGAVCSIAAPDELARLRENSVLFVLGFESGLAENEPFDELKVKQEQRQTELVGSQFLASNSSRIYTLRAPTGKCWQGSPVFNERGHVVGVLATTAGEAKMVPVSQLSSLWKASVKP